MDMIKVCKEDINKSINEIYENTNNGMKWRNSSRHKIGKKEILNWGKIGKEKF